MHPGFNIVVGQNDAGKTAFLEALSLRFTSKPHRSIQTTPSPKVILDSVSSIDISFTISKVELNSLLMQMRTFNLPEPRAGETIGDFVLQSDIRRLPERLLALKSLKFELNKKANSNWSPHNLPSFGVYECDWTGDSCRFIPFTANNQDNTFSPQIARTGHPMEEVGAQIANVIQSSRVYYFLAQRNIPGRCPVGNSPILRPDASNLPEVLSVLQGNNPPRFKEYNELIHEIIPHIRSVSVRPREAIRGGESNSIEIIVWTTDLEANLEHLTIPLDESGTGVGQVLAIIYVVLTSFEPQIILIDEPQSFLHPGAVRKLIGILRSFPQHQFIIATHSPTVIAAVDPKTLLMVKQQNSESTLEVLDPADALHLRSSLREIGASLSDVFGADNILWVEGPTEEECFPRILERLSNRPLMGTAIIAIKNTGDLIGKRANIIPEIYKRLSKGRSLLPPAVGFLYDKEERTPAEQDELIRREGLTRFLPVRMYENYLLNPKAIVAVVNGIQGFREEPVAEQEIKDWFRTKGQDPKYGCKFQACGDEKWQAYVHGAKILKDLFSELSETRVCYDKIVHSVALTEWLIANDPASLGGLRDLLVSILDSVSM